MSEVKIIERIRYHNEMVAFHSKEATRLLELNMGAKSPRPSGGRLSKSLREKIERNFQKKTKKAAAGTATH